MAMKWSSDTKNGTVVRNRLKTLIKEFDLLKVNNRNSRYEICSALTIKTSDQRSKLKINVIDVVLVSLLILGVVLVSLLLNLNIFHTLF